MKIILLLLFTILINAQLFIFSNFKSNFQQTILNKNHKIIKYEGVIKYLRKDIFKWEYKIPIEKEVCLSDDKMTIIDHDLEQIDLYIVKNIFSLENILNNAISIKKNIYKAKFEDITYLIFTKNDKKIYQIKYVDSFDNEVKIIFSNSEYNVKSSKLNMKCYFPPNYDK